jgi:hypothetical protein
MRGHWHLKRENARRENLISCSGGVKESNNPSENSGVPLSGEAKREAPAQAELRPTCAGAHRLSADQ